jgi:Domain of unknown function (DUF1906)
LPACDFSFARPGADELAQAGIVAVGRYLTGAWKALSEGELESYLEAEIAVWFVFENDTDDAAGGAPYGMAHARAADAALTELGLPVETPVYFAADTEIDPPGLAIPYYQGIAAVRPASTNGCYGEGALTQLLHQEGLIGFAWQSESTSFPGNASALPGTNIIQSTLASPITGTDLDILLSPDFGQWPRPDPTHLEENVYMIPSNCTDVGALSAQTREWWFMVTDEEMPSVKTQEILVYAFHVPVASGGFGGSPDLLLSHIIDNAPAIHAAHGT